MNNKSTMTEEKALEAAARMGNGYIHLSALPKDVRADTFAILGMGHLNISADKVIYSRAALFEAITKAAGLPEELKTKVSLCDEVDHLEVTFSGGSWYALIEELSEFICKVEKYFGGSFSIVGYARDIVILRFNHPPYTMAQHFEDLDEETR